MHSGHPQPRPWRQPLSIYPPKPTEVTMTASVAISYPAPIDDQLDEALEALATHHHGQWFGSGVGLIPELLRRDIEFHFEQQDDAQRFVAACQVVNGIQVDRVST